MLDQAPIIAIATAPGRGGIGVVRVSGGAGIGADLQWLVERITARTLNPREATYTAFMAADGSAIDRGIALWFPAPHSYTGEHVLELQGHGGPVVLHLLVERCLAIAREAAHAIPGLRLRMAEPGEFTQRAYLNDKLDLAQAEAVADLIDAQTVAAARSAAASLGGVFSERIHALVDQLVSLRMLVEATLDFPEEEIDFLQQADALPKLDAIEAQLASVLDTARLGALLRDGLKVVLAGVPNAGKSSLLNALAGEEVAIVTPIPGTTRDKVAQTISIDGIPLVVIDTAGLRETDDAVESLGIARTWREVDQADVVVHLHDLAHPDAAENARIAEQIAARAPHVPVLRVFNKADVLDAADLAARQAAAPDAVWISARTHAGLAELRTRLREIAGVQAQAESVFIARERHLVALRTARNHLEAARAQALAGATRDGTLGDAHLDLFAEELRLAQESLASITGEFTADDLLGEIFSRFCIGK